MPRSIDGDKLAHFLMDESVDLMERHKKTETQKDYLEGRNFSNQQIVEKIHTGEFDLPERDMTPEEALAEARKRWGECGFADVMSEVREPYQVGWYDFLEETPGTKVESFSGKTFREAFENADKAIK